MRDRDVIPMTLSQKGRDAPRPTLRIAAAQAVADTLASWHAVHGRAHWLLGDERVVDGADFYVGEDELGHVHLDGDAHVPLTRALRDALIEAGLAEPFPWGRDWVRAKIRGPQDVERVLWLFRLRYDALRGVDVPALIARARARAAG